eukprot:Hpha_TRINITY_DN16611_c5_g1::TRINITY_DN16611_c5_g1_i2::g.179649::m.179649
MAIVCGACGGSKGAVSLGNLDASVRRTWRRHHSGGGSAVGACPACLGALFLKNVDFEAPAWWADAERGQATRFVLESVDRRDGVVCAAGVNALTVNEGDVSRVNISTVLAADVVLFTVRRRETGSEWVQQAKNYPIWWVLGFSLWGCD